MAQAQSATALNGMPWREFEILVGEAYRLQGYRVTETGGDGADGGVDLALDKGGERFLVQCKQWKAIKVGVDVVRELYGVMAAKGATGGFVVTSGRFTQDAKAFAEGRNVKLVDGPELFGMIKRAKQSLTSNPQRPDASAQVKPSEVVAGPACQQCGANMVKRTARRGAKWVPISGVVSSSQRAVAFGRWIQPKAGCSQIRAEREGGSIYVGLRASCGTL